MKTLTIPRRRSWGWSAGSSSRSYSWGRVTSTSILRDKVEIRRITKENYTARRWMIQCLNESIFDPIWENVIWLIINNLATYAALSKLFGIYRWGEVEAPGVASRGIFPVHKTFARLSDPRPCNTLIQFLHYNIPKRICILKTQIPNLTWLHESHVQYLVHLGRKYNEENQTKTLLF